MFRLLKVVILMNVLLFLVGCAAADRTPQIAEKGPPPLRVGITPNYPPLIFKQGENITGIEADLARRLGEALNRPVQFVTLDWDKQIPALMSGKIDIIMSGMSITERREVRINFSEPYLKSGLIAAFRADSAGKFDSVDKILKSYANVGVVEGTTGDAFVKKNMPQATQVFHVMNARDGADELIRRRIDLFIHDAPSIIWTVSEHEADLTALWEPLTKEDFGWGISKDNEELLSTVNDLLASWKADGTLDAVMSRWLPAAYLKWIQ